MQAQRTGLICINPVALTVLPKMDAKKERGVMTLDEQQWFFSYAETSSCFDLFYAALAVGCVMKNCGGLIWSDIDYENGLIHVNRTLNYKKSEGYYMKAP